MPSQGSLERIIDSLLPKYDISPRDISARNDARNAARNGLNHSAFSDIIEPTQNAQGPHKVPASNVSGPI